MRMEDERETAEPALFRRLPDPVIVIDSSGCLVAASEPAAFVFGCGLDELIGSDLSQRLSASSSPELAGLLALMDPSESQADEERPQRLQILRPDGSLAEVTLSLSRVPTGDESLLICSMRPSDPLVRLDVAAEISATLEVGGRLSDQLSRAPSLADARAVLLPVLCAVLSWDAATLWAPDRGQLHCIATWPSNSGPHQSFEDASRGSVLEPDDIVVRSLESGAPVCARIGAGSLTRGREDAAATSGLWRAVAFPLLGSGAGQGAIEFLTVRDEPITPRLIESLATLGRQIGHLLGEVEVRSRGRESERLKAFLLEAASALAGSTDYADALSRLAAISVPEVADLCLIDVKEPHGVIRRMAAVHADPAKGDLVDELAASYPPAAGGLHPSNEAMNHGRSSWSATMPDDFLRATTRDERHFELVKALGFESYMCVPLQVEEEILGSITLVSAGSRRRFHEEDLALAEELAHRAASIVAAARRYEQQHRLTRELQRLLLPEQLPQVDQLELCVRYVPAAVDAVAGGDFYDVVVLPSRRIGIVIGDIEGHDTLAAATMGQLRSAIRALSGQVREPGALIDALHWSWELLGFERLATALVARFDQTSGEVVLASAGHLAPVLIDREGRPRFLEIDLAPPLGAPGGGARETRLLLEVGETLFFYTDGLIEERDVALDRRLERLLEALTLSPQPSVEELCDAVLAHFGRTEHPRDDVAVLAMRRL